MNVLDESASHPYDWIDLDILDEYVGGLGSAGSAVPHEFYEFNDPLKMSPKSIPASGFFPRTEMKLDAFHQTIALPEVNQKERMQAEEVFLIESEWNRLITAHPNDLICMMTPAGIFLRVSENSKDLTGYRQDQLVGVNITNHIHINELPRFYDQLNLVVNAGRVCTEVHQFRGSTSYVRLESTFYTFFAMLMGESRCVIMHSKVVGTAPREVAEVIDKTDQGQKKFISRLTLDGIFTYASPSVSGCLGYTPPEILGRSMYELFPTDELSKLSDTHNQLKHATSEHVTITHKLRRKDGTFNQVESVFAVFKNPVSGALECILCTTSELSSKPVVEETPGLLEKLQKEVQSLRELLLQRTIEIEKLKQERDANWGEGDADKKKRKRKIRTDLQCEQCGTRESPEWRKGPSGNQSLCNACGLRYAKKTKPSKKSEEGTPAPGSRPEQD